MRRAAVFVGLLRRRRALVVARGGEIYLLFLFFIFHFFKTPHLFR